MKFTINTQDFKQVLNTAYKAVPAKASIPMMENFYLQAKDSRLYVTATDGGLVIETNTEITGGEGTACINAKLLVDGISLLPEGSIDISTEGETCTIFYGKGSFKIPCFPSEDFPKVDVNIKGNSSTVVNEKLKDALGYVLPSVADDPMRPVLNGVFFNPVEGGFDIVASDSHSLSMQKVRCDATGGSFIVPTKVAKLLQTLLDDDSTVITTNDTSASFFFAHTVINTVTIVGKFPKYESVIPTANGCELKAKVADLLATVRRVSTCANKASMAIKMSLATFGGCTIEGQDVGFGCSAKETMEDVDYDGEDMTVGFKATLLSSLLGALDEEEVVLRLDNPRKAVLITTANEDRKAIIMPISIQ